MDTIIFDFFGVVGSEVAPFVLPKHMPQDRAVEVKRTLVLDADLGRITQDEMFEKLSAISGVSARALEADFWSYVQIDPAMVAMIESLKPKYRIGLLTNATTPFIRQIIERHDLEHLFDAVLVSSEEHMAKPDPAFYLRLLGRMGAAPAQAVMIDDNPENVAGAVAAGMQGVLFTSATKLAADLKALYAITV
jgi:HAD superfamily hydrolase (TIGR01509 family)